MKFIKTLQLLWRGELADGKELSRSISVNARLMDQLWEVREELKISKESKVERIKVPLAGFDDLECEPLDGADRKGYVDRVDEFYTDVLKDKMYASIAEVRELYGNMYMDAQGMGLTRAEYDWFVRGIEAGLFKIDEWCRRLQSERQSVLQEKENNKE